MHLKQHIAASAAVSTGIFAATGSWPMAVSSFLAGFLLDLDHLIDYWIEYPFNIDISRFFKACHNCELTKTRLYLHSFELVLALAASAYLTRSSVITAVTLGLAQHMALDQLINSVRPAGYFLIYRYSKGFLADRIFTNAHKPGDSNGNDQRT